MCTDPDPSDHIRLKYAQGTIVVSDSYRDKILPSFKPPKPQRRMGRIAEPEAIVLDSQPLYFLG